MPRRPGDRRVRKRRKGSAERRTGPIDRRSGRERRTHQERQYSTPPHAKERVEWFRLPKEVIGRLKEPKPREISPGEFSERRTRGWNRRQKKRRATDK